MDTTQTFKITGMHCTACTKLTARRIKGLTGVKDAEVELRSGRATVVADRVIPLAEIKAALADSEYDAESYDDKNY